ncbi:MAG: biotin--[acetyl-CoA-carboxylase] ligase [Halobacteriaceae archaeon]
MDQSRLEAELTVPVYYEDMIPNTNDRAKQIARSGTSEGTFVIAKEQTAGRGRTGNRWVSPPGGVWSSTVLQPDFPVDKVGRLTFAGGIAVAKTIENYGLQPHLKWPNDILVNGKKIAGILTEISVDGVSFSGKPVDAIFPNRNPAETTIDFAILGIGVNVNNDTESMDLDRAITSFSAEEKSVSPTDVAITLHKQITKYYQFCHSQEGFQRLLTEWKSYPNTIGSEVAIDLYATDTDITGTAVDINANGGLIIDTGTEQREITEGECQELADVTS